MKGIRKTRPGPFAPSARPSRNTISRWYSRTMRNACGRMMISRSRTTPAPIANAITSSSSRGLSNPFRACGGPAWSAAPPRARPQPHAVHRDDPDALAAPRRPADGVGRPLLRGDLDDAAGSEVADDDALAPEQRLVAGDDLTVAQPHRRAHDDEEEEAPRAPRPGRSRTARRATPGTDVSNRNQPPSRIEITPPAVGTPMPGCMTSSTKKTIDATSSPTPISWTGSVPSATSDATNMSPPSRPRDAAGDEELDRDQREPHPEEDEGEVRIEQRVQEAEERAEASSADRRAGDLERDLPVAVHGDGRPVDSARAARPCRARSGR